MTKSSWYFDPWEYIEHVSTKQDDIRGEPLPEAIVARPSLRRDQVQGQSLP